jgi:hypothetical protein
MTLDFNCEGCDASFELELAELLDEEKIQCPSCDAKAPREVVTSMTAAMDELFGSLGRLSKKFTVNFAVESDEMPPPYDGTGVREDDEEEAPARKGRSGRDDDEEDDEDGGDLDEEPLPDEDDDDQKGGVEY